MRSDHNKGINKTIFAKVNLVLISSFMNCPGYYWTVSSLSLIRLIQDLYPTQSLSMV
jgi:hypothetical protein